MTLRETRYLYFRTDAAATPIWVSRALSVATSPPSAQCAYARADLSARYPGGQCRMEIATKGMSVSSRRSAPRQSRALRTLLQFLAQIKSYPEALGIGA